MHGRMRSAPICVTLWPMLIPRYWKRLEEKTTGPGGKEFLLSVWGCSADSREDAETDARRRLDAWKRRIHDGAAGDQGYGYRRNVLREPILEEIAGTDGETVAFVSRNNYGCLVLSTSGALFIDVDVPEDTVGRRVLSLFGGSKASPEEKALATIRTALAARPLEGFRIYRTAAGFRLLGVTRTYEPDSTATQELMNSTGADKAFRILCRVQKSFRARLTPKPWRIGVGRPSFSFPSDDPGADAAVRKWTAKYEPAAAAWATCRFVEHVGPTSVHTDIREVLDRHDAATGATSGRRLA